MKKLGSLSKKQLFLIMFGFLVLLIISEAVYTYSNKSSRLLPHYIAQTESGAKGDDFESAYTNLERAGSVRLEEVKTRYPQKMGKKNLVSPTVPAGINDELLNYLKNLNYQKIKNNYYNELAKTYYSLGLIAYQNQHESITKTLWENASLLDPEWSYYHVELANYYMSQEKFDKAKEQITFCIQFESPKKHCEEFLEQNINQNKTEEVGFLEIKILQI